MDCPAGSPRSSPKEDFSKDAMLRTDRLSVEKAHGSDLLQGGYLKTQPPKNFPIGICLKAKRHRNPIDGGDLITWKATSGLGRGLYGDCILTFWLYIFYEK